MAGTFKFELVTPERILLSIDADEVMVPGSEGDFTVYEGHAPVIATMRPGLLRVKDGKSAQQIYVRSGFAEVTAQTLTILAERAFVVGEADTAEIEAELSLAKTIMAEGADEKTTSELTCAIDELESVTAAA